MARRKTDPEIRFWRKVIKRGPDDCWIWVGTSARYGSFWDGERASSSHRFSLEKKIGRKLKAGRWGEFALHTCDNKRCVNPRHLFVGSSLDNSRDMVRKGRKEKGSDVYGAVLDERKVLKIRVKFATGRYTLPEMGKRFGVCAETIWWVVRGKCWKHIGGPISTTKMKLGPKKGEPRKRTSPEQRQIVLSMRGERTKDIANRSGLAYATVRKILKVD